ncbi:MAG: hypothetical protein ABS95_01180 [Verrucomicrobia bacterium SCN 57-15]|nr:MAG: hypothetical protein ABS95_01180 [Verrucomicrobia bacterium SCN 57-15]
MRIRLKSGSVHIRKNGSIRATGSAANALFAAMMSPEDLRKALDEGQGSQEFQEACREALKAKEAK